MNIDERIERIFEEGMNTFYRRVNKIKICEETFKKPSRIKLFLQHHLNELHLYCKLVKIGVSKETAKKVSRAVYNSVRSFII